MFAPDSCNRLLKNWGDMAGWINHFALADGLIFLAKSIKEVRRVHQTMAAACNQWLGMMSSA